ncbi:hypothetical protein VKI21_11210 [Cyanobacterium aponinum UTEX 3222]|uniref:Uncharacterized protein n=1 Tax=Cyanobacterium aponinum AL20115 TaxID=3090662 RepID=A0AAF0ZB98_9CHRO|nr:hypothetical protein [Cyanobacterium aponinum]PHV61985.1 hypothetical protein CSQ80_12635 [Cyanobacterium aponinum IPPAS B-1201]WPF87133.1 hypothetical protein SAY89_09935 [Cyanobacterium aponinum AL20115]WRL39055.1 hypothetical protein VKI22_02865 [Cyanobacterium aponinum UTEX 3221]WRL40637.1 hypothetical protein VKI21_11210 [Cyanobacterium aponinum UTEX 3222]
MTDNSEKNIYSVIELKKSLKRTMIQLQKAIDILNQNSPDDLPNLTVVENLVKSSNALVDYLQLKNSSGEANINTVQSQEEKTETSEPKKVRTSNKKQKSFVKINQNFLLVLVLIISISFNIIALTNNSIFPKKNVSVASNVKDEEIISQTDNDENINIGDNIFLEPQIEEKVEQKNDETEEQEAYQIGENIFQEEENNQELDTTVSEKNDNNNEQNNNNPSEPEIISSEDETDLIKENQIDTPKSSNLNSTESQETSEPKQQIEENDQEDEGISLLTLNPEQYIIKNIENQIENITQKYGENLIVRVKANFSNNSLIITVGEKWYELSSNKQNNFAEEVFKQVKSLDFYKFKLENTEGKILARNAVVGEGIILIP